MPERDPEKRNSIIRQLTEEEIEEAKHGRGLSKKRKKYYAEKLGPSFVVSPLRRICRDCQREIGPNERAFKVHAEPTTDQQDYRNKRQWRCEECHLKHEEETIKSHTAKGFRKRFLLRSKSS